VIYIYLYRIFTY